MCIRDSLRTPARCDPLLVGQPALVESYNQKSSKHLHPTLTTLRTLANNTELSYAEEQTFEEAWCTTRDTRLATKRSLRKFHTGTVLWSPAFMAAKDRKQLYQQLVQYRQRYLGPTPRATKLGFI